MTKAHSLTFGIILTLGIVALAQMIAGSAAGETYPVSGRWTYQDAAGTGPSEDCSKPTMEFRGDYRSDTSGGVADFRNVSVERTSASSFVVKDLFLTAPNVRGNVTYTLRLTDEDHIQITLAGKTIRLRRCG
jgi:hypothetical protein